MLPICRLRLNPETRTDTKSPLFRRDSTTGANKVAERIAERAKDTLGQIGPGGWHDIDADYAMLGIERVTKSIFPNASIIRHRELSKMYEGTPRVISA